FIEVLIIIYIQFACMPYNFLYFFAISMIRQINFDNLPMFYGSIMGALDGFIIMFLKHGPKFAILSFIMFL
ncbi:hypothetical protein ACJX0J_028404, partial [Zea mays]